MSYGYRARFRRSSSSFSRRRLGTGRGITRRPGLYRSRRRGVFKPRFATVGFSRNVEKKYFDKTYISNSLEVLTGESQGAGREVSNGVTYISNKWGDYSFGTQAQQIIQSNDMLKGVATGTTARTRIGNKMKCDYVKGAFTFTADADSPQKTCSFMISGSRIGSIRYNGPGASALTDKGLYVVWSAFVMGYGGKTDDIKLPSPVGHSRLCFNDD